LRRLAAGVWAIGVALLAQTPAARADDAVLRICSTGDYPPLTFRDAAGEYVGADMDMGRDLAAALGRTPVFVATTWPTLSQDLTAAGRCDIAMGGISVTPTRAEVGEFTPTYLSSGKVPITQAESAQRFTTIEAINQPGVRVIENPGGTNEQFAREYFPLATLTTWPDNATVFDELAAGNADVMITDAIEASYQAARRPGLTAVNPDQPFTHDAKAYLLPSGSPLIDAVNGWLRQALADGTFARFYDRAMA
jgi:cyclohexadienyl dehydratase